MESLDVKPLIIELTGTRRGLYEANTGKWLKWLGKDEYNKLRFQDNVKVVDNRKN